ncbi:MAG: response regulator [Bryobacteraceae bacterium]
MSAKAKRILVADDKASSRELVRTMLERSGYAVSEAADGVEAIELIRREQFDLILLDLQMPALDGFGVLRHVRDDQRLATLPVVALTASAMQGDQEKALAAGFTGYIAKPVSLATLRRELAALLS